VRAVIGGDILTTFMAALSSRSIASTSLTGCAVGDTTDIGSGMSEFPTFLSEGTCILLVPFAFSLWIWQKKERIFVAKKIK